MKLLDDKATQAKASVKFRRAAFVMMGAALLCGPSFAAAENDAGALDAWESLAQFATTRADDSALAEARGMGGMASVPDAVAVILWDEKNTCCGRPGPAPVSRSEGGMNTVSFRVVIQK